MEQGALKLVKLIILCLAKEELAHMIKSALVPPSNDVFGNDHLNLRWWGRGTPGPKVAVSDGLHAAVTGEIQGDVQWEGRINQSKNNTLSPEVVGEDNSLTGINAAAHLS